MPAPVTALRRWLSPSLDIDLQVGGAYRFLGPDEQTWISGSVQQIDAVALSDVLAPWLATYEPYWSAALRRLRALAETPPP